VSSRTARSYNHPPIHLSALTSNRRATATGWDSDPLPDAEVDVVIVGAGIGGLSAAALLGKYGVRAAVVEAHSVAGGAAHGFSRKGFHFDSGPSYFLGLSSPKGQSINGLRQVMDAVGEEVKAVTYNHCQFYFPDGDFRCVADRESYRSAIRRFAGDGAVAEWDALEEAMLPLGDMALATPFAAMRGDAGVALTLGPYLPAMLGAGLSYGAAGLASLPLLQGYFSTLVDKYVTDPWLKRMLDLECFVISGLTAKETSAAEMAFLFRERHREGAEYDYPLGGSQALVDALVRGVRKFGGSVTLRAPVERFLVEDGRVAGVRLADGRELRARRKVVTNASVWDTMRLLPPPGEGGELDAAIAAARAHVLGGDGEGAPACGSFMHLHVGIDAAGLPEDLGIHHMVVRNWDLGVEGDLNVFNISIPSALDPSLAPPGKHVVHIYGAANEPYEEWAHLERGSEEYERKKAEKGEILWAALEKAIPDVRERAEVAMVGTPLTQQRFVGRCNGTYGPAADVTQRNLYGDDLLPGPDTGIAGLMAVGDSCFPGIGVPAAAGSGFYVANTLAGVGQQRELLREGIGANV